MIAAQHFVLSQSVIEQFAAVQHKQNGVVLHCSRLKTIVLGLCIVSWRLFANSLLGCAMALGCFE